MFYKWWFHLSELDIGAAIRRGIGYAISTDRWLYGQRLLSLRSLVGAIATTALIALVGAIYFMPKQPVSLIARVLACLLAILINLPVGIVAVFSTRALLRSLYVARSMPLAIAFSVLNVLLIEVVTLAFWFVVGGSLASVLTTCYSRGVSVDKTASTCVFFIVFAHGYSNRFLQFALVPMYGLMLFVFILVASHTIGKVCFFAQRFLSWQVEKPKFAALTALLAGTAAIAQLSIVVGETLPIRWACVTFSAFHKEAVQHTTLHGMKVITPLIFPGSPSDSKWRSFTHDVANALDLYGDKMGVGQIDIEQLQKSFLDSFFRHIGLPHANAPLRSPTPVNSSPLPNAKAPQKSNE